MNDERMRTFCEAIALVDAGLELQRSEIADIRRALSEQIERVKGASSEQERGATAGTAYFYVIGAMESRVKATAEAQRTIERILNEWKRGT